MCEIDVVINGIQYVPVGSGISGLCIPLITAVVMPMKNIHLAWYEATRVYGAYNCHPERCEDWNLESGGNTDLGEPLIAPFSGLVLAASNYGGGIGNVVQIIGLDKSGAIIVWSGWHLLEVAVVPGQIITVGDDIGSIGNADGRYAGAHLHEQICEVYQTSSSGIPSPTTFAGDTRYNFVQPSEFYKSYLDVDEVDRVANKDNQ